MSNVDDNDGIDVNDDDNDANGPKALRDELKKVKKQLADLQTENGTLKTSIRNSSIAEFLAEHKASPKLAKYVNRDLEGDVTSESVRAWLESEGELFGWEPADADDADEDPRVEQQRRISAATSTAPESRTGLTVEKIASSDFKALIDAGIINP